MLYKPVIILANPLCGENIGAIARVMANFGLNDLRVVKSDFTNFGTMLNAARILATYHNLPILEQIKKFMYVDEAIVDLEYLVAFSSRCHSNLKINFELQQIMSVVSSQVKVGFLYGNEKWGLENHELALATACCIIPTAIGNHSSLNLAQAVAVSVYQWFQTTYKNNTKQPPLPQNATIHELSLFFQSLRYIIHNNGYDISNQDIVQEFYNFCLRSYCSRKDLRLLYKITEFLSKPKTID